MPQIPPLCQLGRSRSGWFKGKLSLDSRPGANTTLRREGGVDLVDTLLGPSRHHLAKGKSKRVESVRTLCLEGRAALRNPETVPGKKWAGCFVNQYLLGTFNLEQTHLLGQPHASR